MQQSSLGRHLIVDFYDCTFESLDDIDCMIETFKEAVEKAGMTLLNLSHHRFQPQGVTVLALLSESHLSIHTFPEIGAATLDCYTCGDGDPQAAIDVLKNVIKPGRHSVRELIRGEEL